MFQEEEPLYLNQCKMELQLCHDVLAVLAEVVSGMRFSEYMKNIFELWI